MLILFQHFFSEHFLLSLSTLSFWSMSHWSPVSKNWAALGQQGGELVLLALPIFIQPSPLCRSGKLLSQPHLHSSTPAWLENISGPGALAAWVDVPCAQWSQGEMPLNLIWSCCASESWTSARWDQAAASTQPYWEFGQVPCASVCPSAEYVSLSMPLRALGKKKNHSVTTHYLLSASQE